MGKQEPLALREVKKKPEEKIEINPDENLMDNLTKNIGVYGSRKSTIQTKILDINDSISVLEEEKGGLEKEIQEIEDKADEIKLKTVMAYFDIVSEKLAAREKDRKTVIYFDGPEFEKDLMKLKGIGREEFQASMKQRRDEAHKRWDQESRIEFYLTRESSSGGKEISVLYAPISWKKAETKGTIEEDLYLNLLNVAEEVNGPDEEKPEEYGRFTVCKFPPGRKDIQKNERTLICKIEEITSAPEAAYTLKSKVWRDKEKVQWLEAIHPPEAVELEERLNLSKVVDLVIEEAKKHGELLERGSYVSRVQRAIISRKLMAEKKAHGNKFYYLIQGRELENNLKSLAAPSRMKRTGRAQEVKYSVSEVVNILVKEGRYSNIDSARPMVYSRMRSGELGGVEKKPHDTDRPVYILTGRQIELLRKKGKK